MKKVVVLVIILAVAGGGYYFLNKEGSNIVGNESASQAAGGVSSGGKYKLVDACSLVTLDDAKSQLGEAAKQGNTSAGKASSDDVVESNCVYYVTSTTTSAFRTVSVLSRTAKTKDGAEKNRNQFRDLKPPGVVDVADLGDAAFWNPETGEMNVLKGDNWYKITVGSTKISDRKQSDAHAFVTSIQSKL